MKHLAIVIMTGVILAGCGKTTVPTATDSSKKLVTTEEVKKTSKEIGVEEEKARRTVESFLKMTKEGLATGGNPFTLTGAVGSFLTKGAIRSVMATQDILGNVRGLAQIPNDPDWSYRVGDVQVHQDGTNASVEVEYTSKEGVKMVSFMVGEEDGSWKIDSTN